MNFQDVILTLQRYWGAAGCVLLQPHDLMMGAGTFHPATALRSVGPGPWRCAYLQPCRRPGDARYGDNPNRLGHYYQFQVILKPSPPDVQDLYLGSLAAIGIDLSANDVRFVEDDWESPTLGAWGLGWEVWLNGMEATQFTYFQQVGGIATVPVPAELTYGLERLAMSLQGVDSIFDVTWVDGVTYRDVFHRNEVEQSKYNFEHADPEALLAEFDRNATSAADLTERGLSLPAYDRAVMASHIFNLLDARGAISVAERAQYIRRVRDLAVGCVQVWHEQVARHEAPVVAEVVADPAADPAAPVGQPGAARRGRVRGAAGVLRSPRPRPARPGPRGPVGGDPPRRGRHLRHPPPAGGAHRRRGGSTAGVGQAGHRSAGGSGVRRRRCPHPGRHRLRPRQGGRSDGPAGGRGPQGAGGRRRDHRRGRGGHRSAGPGPASGVLSELSFGKTMEWGTGGTRWARPVHRVNVVYDGVRVAGRALDLPFGNETIGHRLSRDPVFAFDGAEAWLAGLRERRVEPDIDDRRARIEALLAEATRTLSSDPIHDGALLEEVLFLVEAPTLVIGQFDPELLALPNRLLVQSMKEHQRYFPVFRDGALDHHFVVISNNPWGDADPIAAGNAAVIHARFDDARFFLAEDRKVRLEERGAALAGMRWIRGLGTMADKAARVSTLAEGIAGSVGADPAVARRAGALCKADLVTLMVGEFPELQGHMGRLYAEGQGERTEVAMAIEEAWHPEVQRRRGGREPGGGGPGPGGSTRHVGGLLRDRPDPQGGRSSRAPPRGPRCDPNPGGAPAAPRSVRSVRPGPRHVPPSRGGAPRLRRLDQGPRRRRGPPGGGRGPAGPGGLLPGPVPGPRHGGGGHRRRGGRGPRGRRIRCP